MDVSAFADFLVSKLTDLKGPLENSLKKVAFPTMEQMHRASGTLDMIEEIVTKMDGLVNEFTSKTDPRAVASQNDDASV